jgi:hypothetical protein
MFVLADQHGSSGEILTFQIGLLQVAAWIAVIQPKSQPSSPGSLSNGTGPTTTEPDQRP